MMELHLTVEEINWILHVTKYTYYTECKKYPVEKVVFEKGYLQLANKTKLANKINILLKDNYELFDFFIASYREKTQKKALQWVQDFFNPKKLEE